MREMCATAADRVASTVSPQALQVLDQQPRVRDYLAKAYGEGRISHAYLFVGAPGSGMHDAARALAQLIVCPHGGDASCDECIRVAHRTHPDVRYLKPESATGYLVSQVRGLIDDVPLAPVRAKGKLYILDDAGLLRDASANALLKTIEEPPRGVHFVLMARSAAAVLPTIVSRCQQLPFRVVLPGVAERAVELASGSCGGDARIALAVTGSPGRAAEFLASSDRQQARREVVRALDELARDDMWDVLISARRIVDAVRVPLDEYKLSQQASLKERADYLAPPAMRRIEAANKRELTARQRSGMMEALAAAESLLRDVLIRREGVDESLVNEDAADVVDRMAQASTSEAVIRALGCVSGAACDLAHNVTPQLVMETMLLSVKEALACPPSYR